MSNVTKPDALDMLRDAIKEANHPFGVSVYNANQIIAALEAERAESAIAADNDNSRLFAMERKVAAIANRDAKIRKAILSALHPDTSDKKKHLHEAFALLLNDTIAPVVSA